MKIEVEYTPTPEELAAAFWEMDAVGQAKFLQEVALIDKPSLVQSQMCYLAKELPDEAREMVEDLVQFLKPPPDRLEDVEAAILEAWPKISEKTLKAMLGLAALSHSTQITWKSKPVGFGSTVTVFPEIDLMLRNVPIVDIGLVGDIVWFDGSQVGVAKNGVMQPDGTLSMDVVLKNFETKVGLKFMVEEDLGVPAEKCPDCRGTGEYHGFMAVEKCSACGGSGKVQ